MAKYLMLESRDPFETNGIDHYYETAANLAKDGNEVILFLVQNGVIPARPSVMSAGLTKASKAGVKVRADEFSLRERGIDKGRLAEGVEASPLDLVIDKMADGYKTMWH